jgi:uncharacterized protein (UPF0371 family)
LKEVTDDIVARGITSNKVINKYFEYHINKNKSVLNENKMRELLNTLRMDIGVPNDDRKDGNTLNSILNSKRRGSTYSLKNAFVIY